MNYRSTLKLHDSIMTVTELWAQARSKDPSSKVGAAIYDKSTGAVHLGYNGFPIGVEDEAAMWDQKDPAKVCKYDLVIHAEKNAMVKALAAGCKAENMILFCSHAPCAQCWRDVVGAVGIKHVVIRNPTYPSRTPKDDMVQNHFITALHIRYEVLS